MMKAAMQLVARSTLGASLGSTNATADFVGNEIAVSERSELGCVLITAATDPAALHESATAATGVELPMAAGRIGRAAKLRALWLTPRSWLVLCEEQAEGALVQRINTTFTNKCLHGAHFGDYLCWISLAGQRSHEILRDSAFISLERAGLPLYHAKRTLIAGIAAVIVREAEHDYLIGVERSRARYFADRLFDSAHQITPEQNS